VLLALLALQRPSKTSAPTWLPPLESQPEKREYEVWALKYSVVWMACFALIIALELYEAFDALAYNAVCGGLALPLVLQPLLFRGPCGRGKASVAEQHAARAQLWIAIFGFVGNYWYTHYFYCVLRARYTMHATRLNDVPICMYWATHFYFSSYHVFSNLALRRVITGYQPGPRRDALFAALVAALSYSTAFMETLTISHFPYYDFEDRDMAYTLGSAFYGIYFLVSFPAYFSLDEPGGAPLEGLLGVSFHSLGAGMLVLILLDLTRLACAGVPLTIGGTLFEITAAAPA